MRIGLEARFATAERLAQNAVCSEEFAFRAFVCQDERAGNRFREETWNATKNPPIYGSQVSAVAHVCSALGAPEFSHLFLNCLEYEVSLDCRLHVSNRKPEEKHPTCSRGVNWQNVYWGKRCFAGRFGIAVGYLMLFQA